MQLGSGNLPELILVGTADMVNFTVILVHYVFWVYTKKIF